MYAAVGTCHIQDLHQVLRPQRIWPNPRLVASFQHAALPACMVRQGGKMPVVGHHTVLGVTGRWLPDTAFEFAMC